VKDQPNLFFICLLREGSCSRTEKCCRNDNGLSSWTNKCKKSH